MKIYKEIENFSFCVTSGVKWSIEDLLLIKRNSKVIIKIRNKQISIPIDKLQELKKYNSLIIEHRGNKFIIPEQKRRDRGYLTVSIINNKGERTDSSPIAFGLDYSEAWCGFINFLTGVEETFYVDGNDFQSVYNISDEFYINKVLEKDNPDEIYDQNYVGTEFSSIYMKDFVEKYKSLTDKKIIIRSRAKLDPRIFNFGKQAFSISEEFAKRFSLDFSDLNPKYFTHYQYEDDFRLEDLIKISSRIKSMESISFDEYIDFLFKKNLRPKVKKILNKQKFLGLCEE